MIPSRKSIGIRDIAPTNYSGGAVFFFKIDKELMRFGVVPWFVQITYEKCYVTVQYIQFDTPPKSSKCSSMNIEDNEIWKRASGALGQHYRISNFGRIKSMSRITHQKCRWGQKIKKRYPGRVLKTNKKKNGAGYLGVALCINGKIIYKDVHRLVAEAFYGSPSGMQVNHKNLNKIDNRLENLEWVTPSQNIQHAKANGRKFGKSMPGDKNPNSKLTSREVKFIRKTKGEIFSKALAEKFGVSRGTIDSIRQNRSWII